MYFEASWTIPFDKSLTRKVSHSPYETTAKVDMMSHGEEIRASYSMVNGTVLVELNYQKCKNIRMGLILPKDSHHKKNLETFIESFNVTVLDTLLKETKRRDIELEMPRFEAKEKFDTLQGPLEGIGISTPFQSSEFDFSRATTAMGLFVSRSFIK